MARATCVTGSGKLKYAELAERMSRIASAGSSAVVRATSSVEAGGVVEHIGDARGDGRGQGQTAQTGDERVERRLGGGALGHVRLPSRVAASRWWRA